MTDELKAIRQKPNKDLIHKLDEMLEAAKSGELQAILYVCLWSDDQTGHSWAIPVGRKWKVPSMIGEVHMAMTRLANTADGVDSRIIEDV